MHPTAGQWLSPKVVTRKSVPKLDILLPCGLLRPELLSGLNEESLESMASCGKIKVKGEKEPKSSATLKDESTFMFASEPVRAEDLGRPRVPGEGMGCGQSKHAADETAVVLSSPICRHSECLVPLDTVLVGGCRPVTTWARSTGATRRARPPRHPRRR